MFFMFFYSKINVFIIYGTKQQQSQLTGLWRLIAQTCPPPQLKSWLGLWTFITSQWLSVPPAWLVRCMMRSQPAVWMSPLRVWVRCSQYPRGSAGACPGASWTSAVYRRSYCVLVDATRTVLLQSSLISPWPCQLADPTTSCLLDNTAEPYTNSRRSLFTWTVFTKFENATTET